MTKVFSVNVKCILYFPSEDKRLTTNAWRQTQKSVGSDKFCWQKWLKIFLWEESEVAQSKSHLPVFFQPLDFYHF